MTFPPDLRVVVTLLPSRHDVRKPWLTVANVSFNTPNELVSVGATADAANVVRLLRIVNCL